MTFDEWWDTTKANATPETYKGWEASCRQAWAVAALQERRRWEKALGKTLEDVEVVGTVTIAQGRNAGTYNLVAEKQKTLAQRMRDAGFTRRPSVKSLPNDE